MVDIIQPPEHEGVDASVELIGKTVVEIRVGVVELKSPGRRILYLHINHPRERIIRIFDVFYFHNEYKCNKFWLHLPPKKLSIYECSSAYLSR